MKVGISGASLLFANLGLWLNLSVASAACDTTTCSAMGGQTPNGPCQYIDKICVCVGGSTGTCQCSTTTQNNPNGTSCTIANDKCVLAASCQSGTCTATSTIQCNNPPASQCYKVPGACNTTTGICSYVVMTGSPCTTIDRCQANTTCQADGSCVGTPYTCTAPANNPCVASVTCNGSVQGCTDTYATKGTACDDMNLCTVGDACDGNGGCNSGPPKVCTPPNTQCYNTAKTSCDSKTGNCSFVQLAAGTTCDDGDPCTYTDTCQPNGDCKGAQGPTCAATAACPIAGMCDGKGGCIAPAEQSTKGNCGTLQSGAACSTCDPCQVNQTCNANGDCVGAAVTDGTPCSTQTCAGGQCASGTCVCQSGSDLSMSLPDGSSNAPDLSAVSGDGGSTPKGAGKGGCSFTGVEQPNAWLFVLALAWIALLARRRTQ